MLNQFGRSVFRKQSFEQFPFESNSDRKPFIGYDNFLFRIIRDFAQFAGGKNIRLDGFAKLFAHDAVITPDECGSPVFDRKGQFLWINIARFSRTATLVIPVDVMEMFIRKALNL